MTPATIGHYTITGKLGEGGMGVVYRATDTRLGREVALKLLPPASASDPVARERFLREARAAGRLDHPNVVTTHEIGEHEGSLYIVMALCDGETLRERLERGRLPLAEVEAIVAQLLDGAEAAHEAGIVHRDLKPSNVILHRGRQVKIVDFGIAKLRETEGVARDLTTEGVALGTVAYMSPEQALGETVDYRTDLWAIGVMAHEMVTGTHPFVAPTAPAILARILSEEPPPPARAGEEVPTRLRTTIRGLLRKRPDERFGSAARVRSALASDAPPTKAMRRPGRTRLVPRRHVRAAVGLVLVGAATGALLLSHGRLNRATPSVLVLPCQVFGDNDAAFLTDAVPSTLSTLLGQVPGLDTRRPPTSAEIDPRRADLARLAQSHAVDACVTCSVTADVSRLRLEVSVVQPESGRLLWSHSYDGTMGSFVDVVRRSAEGVRGALLPGDAPPLALVGTAGTSDAELALRRGMHHLGRFNNMRTPADLAAATTAFENALRLDPRLADAAAGLALLNMWAAGPGRPERIQAADEWARRAVELDPHCSFAWTALVFNAGQHGEADHDEVLTWALKAASYGPTNELAHYALGSALGNSSAQLGLAAMQQATRIDPAHSWGLVGEALMLARLSRLDEALERLGRAAELDPDMSAATINRCLFLALAGRNDEAASLLAVIESQPEDLHPAYFREQARLTVALQRGNASERKVAADAIAALIEDGVIDESIDYVYSTVPVLARVGARSVALDVLERASLKGAHPSCDWLVGNHDLATLRREARFQAIVRAECEAARRTVAVLEDARAHGELPQFLEEPLARVKRELERVVAPE